MELFSMLALIWDAIDAGSRVKDPVQLWSEIHLLSSQVAIKFNFEYGPHTCSGHENSTFPKALRSPVGHRSPATPLCANPSDLGVGLRRYIGLLHWSV
jgi:hypothetical protein